MDLPTFIRSNVVVPLWRTTMTSSGSSGDLDVAFPIMMAAGQPYLAANTGEQIQRVLTETSPEVVAIRRD